MKKHFKIAKSFMCVFLALQFVCKKYEIFVFRETALRNKRHI